MENKIQALQKEFSGIKVEKKENFLFQKLPNENKYNEGRNIQVKQEIKNPKELIRLSFIGAFSKLLFGTKLYNFNKVIEFYTKDDNES